MLVSNLSCGCSCFCFFSSFFFFISSFFLALLLLFVVLNYGLLAGMGSLVMTNRVVAELDKLFPGLYSLDNVAISGTHTHSGPSGFLQEVMFLFSGSGWQPATINAMIEGVVQSIVMAHKNLQPATAKVAVGELQKSNINRSPTAYANNPPAEIAEYDANTDLNMTLLRIDGANGQELGKPNNRKTQ